MTKRRGVILTVVLIVALAIAAIPTARWAWIKWRSRTVPVEASIVDRPVVDDAQALIFANDEPGPRTLVLFMHGHGGSANTLQLPRAHEFTQTLVDSGAVVASSDAAGNTWGSPDTVADYKALHQYVAGRWDIDSTVIVGESMGAIPAVNMTVAQDIPDVNGVVLISPVVNLKRAAEQGPLVDTIRGDGADVEAVDPMRHTSLPVPVRIHSSPDDGVVALDDINEWIDGRPAVEFVECKGDHVPEPCYDPESVLDLAQ